MSQNATAINNSGLEDQFDYLCDEAGLEWVEEALLKDEAAGEGDDV